MESTDSESLIYRALSGRLFSLIFAMNPTSEGFKAI